MSSNCLVKDPQANEKNYDAKVYHDYVDDKKEKKGYTGTEIYYRIKRACVTIETHTTYSFGDEKFVLVISGSGFFIKGGYIVTCAHIVMTDPIGRSPPPPISTPDFARVDKIYVHVDGVNDGCKNYIYQATLVGVDGAGDIALLKIDPCNEWNKSLPKICRSKQPYFCFGKSRDYAIGRKTYVIGNALSVDLQSFSEGTVKDNRNFNRWGIFGGSAGETVIVTNDVLQGNSGSPIIDEYGHVIGMISFSLADVYGNTENGGPSQYFMERVIKALKDGPRGCYGKHLEEIPDVLGKYQRYLKGFLGIAWRPYNAFDFVFYPNTTYKKDNGIIIVLLTLDSPFLSTFQPLLLNGDDILITHINDCLIGEQGPAISPAIITWHSLPQDKVKLTYRLGSENFAECHNVTSDLASFPYFLDYVGSGVMGKDVVEKKDNKLKRLCKNCIKGKNVCNKCKVKNNKHIM